MSGEITKLSKVALGTVQLGLNYGISNDTGKPDIIKSYNILDTANRLGIDTLDTAQAYGNSEEIIGNYCCQSKSKFKIITKIPHINNKLSLRDLTKILDNSLSNLKTDCIHGLMFHSFKDFLDNLDVSRDFFNKLKDIGTVQKTGVSVYSVNEVNELLEYPEVDLIQAPMNIFDLELYSTNTLNILEKRNIEYYIRSVFLQGLFFMDEKTISKKLPEALPFIKSLNDFCNNRSFDKASIAISTIHTLLKKNGKIVFGVNSEDQIKTNLELIQDNLTNETLDFAIKLSQSIPEKVKNPALWSK